MIQESGDGGDERVSTKRDTIICERCRPSTRGARCPAMAPNRWQCTPDGRPGAAAGLDRHTKAAACWNCRRRSRGTTTQVEGRIGIALARARRNRSATKRPQAEDHQDAVRQGSVCNPCGDWRRDPTVPHEAGHCSPCIAGRLSDRADRMTGPVAKWGRVRLRSLRARPRTRRRVRGGRFDRRRRWAPNPRSRSPRWRSARPRGSRWMPAGPAAGAGGMPATDRPAAETVAAITPPKAAATSSK